MLAKRSKMEKGLMQRTTATKRTNSSTAENKEKDAEEDHPKGEEQFDDKQGAMLPRETKEQAQFDDNVLYEWMVNERVPIDYGNKNLQL